MIKRITNTVTIMLDKWARTNSTHDSSCKLFKSKKGQYCWVGFIANQAYGLSDNDLDGTDTPWDLLHIDGMNLAEGSLRLALGSLILINDSGKDLENKTLSDAAQLALLIEKTEKLGFKVNVIEKSEDLAKDKEPEPELKYLGDD